MYNVYMMNRMQVYIPEELYLPLKNMAAVKDVSMSELIRKGLKKILAQDQAMSDPMKDFVGKYKGKSKTNAVGEINKYYQKKIG